MSKKPWVDWKKIKDELADAGEPKVFPKKNFGKNLEALHSQLWLRINAKPAKDSKEKKAMAAMAKEGQKLTADVAETARNYREALDKAERAYDKGKEMSPKLGKAFSEARKFLDGKTGWDDKNLGFTKKFWVDGHETPATKFVKKTGQ